MISWLISILFFIGVPGKVSELESYLGEKLAGHERFEYEIVSIPRGFESINDERISLNRERSFKINYGFAYVPVDIKLGEDVTTNSFISLKLKLYDEVIVTVRKIEKGESLSAGDFVTEKRETTFLRNEAVKNLSDVFSYRAAKSINENSILQKNMVEPLPLIEIGQRVNAYSTVGTVTVSFDVTAKEDGGAGEIIRVLRDDRRLFMAEVISSEKVKIIE